MARHASQYCLIFKSCLSLLKTIFMDLTYVGGRENQSHLLEISGHASPASTTYIHCGHNQYIIIATSKAAVWVDFLRWSSKPRYLLNNQVEYMMQAPLGGEACRERSGDFPVTKDRFPAKYPTPLLAGWTATARLVWKVTSCPYLVLAPAQSNIIQL